MDFDIIKKHDTDWFKVLIPENVRKYLSKIEGGKVLKMSIVEPRKKRNLDQNALLHAMLSEIDEIIGNYDLELTKWQIKIEIGHYCERMIGDRIEKFPLPTANLDQKEFALLIDRLKTWAWDFHQIDFPPPGGRPWE